MMTCDQAIDYMRSRGFNIKVVLIENYPGTDAETGKMEMYISLKNE